MDESVLEAIRELDNTSYDVVICGYGLPQSLLALALSRSGKKILHTDKNKDYGGSQPNLLLDEATKWSQGVLQHPLAPDSSLYKAAETEAPSQELQSRRDRVSLAPQILHWGSDLLDALWTSKANEELYFQALGAWWIYAHANETSSTRTLFQVPTSREEILWGDFPIGSLEKTRLWKLLTLLRNYEDEEHQSLWEHWNASTFSAFVAGHYKITNPMILEALHALTLTPKHPCETTTGYAVPRLARTIKSIAHAKEQGYGFLVPEHGFSGIIETACFACARGGAIYVSPQSLTAYPTQRESNETSAEPTNAQLAIKLRNVTLFTEWFIGSVDDLPHGGPGVSETHQDYSSGPLSYSISIVSQRLNGLLPWLKVNANGSNLYADAAVVVFPSGSLSVPGISASSNIPPVNILVQCPGPTTPWKLRDSSTLYASIALKGELAREILKLAVEKLLGNEQVTAEPPGNPEPEKELKSQEEQVPREYPTSEKETKPRVLWSLHYESELPPSSTSAPGGDPQSSDKVFIFPRPSTDLFVGESILPMVEKIWHRIVGGDVKDFMKFR